MYLSIQTMLIPVEGTIGLTDATIHMPHITITYGDAQSALTIFNRIRKGITNGANMVMIDDFYCVVETAIDDYTRGCKKFMGVLINTVKGESLEGAR